MKNKDIDCKDMAEAIRALMGVPSFINILDQVEGERYRNFRVSSLTGDADSASMLFNFAGHGFKIDISRDPDYVRGAEDEY